MDKYEVIIYWSAEDNAFVAEVPELAGCMAHGPSHESALANIKDAMASMDRDREGVWRSDSGAQRPPTDVRVASVGHASVPLALPVLP